MNRLKTPLLVLVLAVFTASCENPVSPEDPQCDISISQSKFELKIGSTKNITVDINDEQCLSNIVWESSDPSIAEIKSIDKKSAKVTAKKNGKAEITAYIKNNPEVRDKTQVTVPFNPVIAYMKKVNGEMADIWIADIHGNERQITDNSNGQEISPRWTEGDRITYLTHESDGSKIYSVNTEGKDKKLLTDDFNTIGWFDISHDGKSLVLGARLEDGGPSEIYVQNLETEEITRITFKNIENGAVPSTPTWSPDKGKITFTQIEGNDSEVYISNPDGSDMQNITNSSSSTDGGPRWSPFDKSKILFTSDRNGDLAHYVMNADGSNVQFVTSEFGCTSWISKKEIACEGKTSSNDFDLYKVGIDGTKELILNTPSNEDTFNPDWRPETD